MTDLGIFEAIMRSTLSSNAPEHVVRTGTYVVCVQALFANASDLWSRSQTRTEESAMMLIEIQRWIHDLEQDRTIIDMGYQFTVRRIG